VVGESQTCCVFLGFLFEASRSGRDLRCQCLAGTRVGFRRGAMLNKGLILWLFGDFFLSLDGWLGLFQRIAWFS
jgi:hypothetical protein